MSTEEATATPATVWEYVEACPRHLSALGDLWSWSLNHDAKTAPFPLFLDLVDYAQDRFGSKCSVWAVTDCAGYGSSIELGYLVNALELFVEHPRECEEWLDGLFTFEDA
jgi:hypothetical protein